MSEQKTLTCPNCGAAVTNHSNCEFCGSLLVRFVDKGIDLSKTTYLNDNATFKGLAEALQRNLELQSQTTESVITDIYDGNIFMTSVLRSGKARWSDKNEMKLSASSHGLIVTTLFGEDDQEYHDRFKQLDSFHLFNAHAGVNNDGDRFIEYAIDFGSDADGAARVLSEILTKVWLRSIDTTLSYHTNVGSAIYTDRKAMDDDSDWGWLWWWLIPFILGIWWLFS